jgi:YD repeat-containing protein
VKGLALPVVGRTLPRHCPAAVPKLYRVGVVGRRRAHSSRQASREQQCGHLRLLKVIRSSRVATSALASGPQPPWRGVEAGGGRYGRATISAMTNPSTKILLPLLALAMMTGAASAQQRTLYDARANVVGRSSTDSSGAVTSYDARGRVISRESTSGNTTTVYDASRRNVGKVTTNR